MLKAEALRSSGTVRCQCVCSCRTPRAGTLRFPRTYGTCFHDFDFSFGGGGTIYIYIYSDNIYISKCTWNPKDLCLARKRPYFEGLTFKYRHHSGSRL